MKKLIFLLCLLPLGVLAQSTSFPDYRVEINKSQGAPAWDSTMNAMDSFVVYYQWGHPTDPLLSKFLKIRASVDEEMREANRCLKHVDQSIKAAQKSIKEHDSYAASQYTHSADEENKEMGRHTKMAQAYNDSMKQQLLTLIKKDKAEYDAKKRKIQ